RASAMPKWAAASSCEWSSVSPRMPAFRPLAPYPAIPCSRIAIESAGSSSFKKIAVHRPVKPAPTIVTSARSSPPSAWTACSGCVASQKQLCSTGNRGSVGGGRELESSLAVDLTERLLERRQEPVELRIGDRKRWLDSQNLGIEVGA